ncbi:MAG: amidohydrolase family protein [Planctomycetes bacterium]|nr:amidohydrolase family protein [Planctomycetota bacterium]
MIDAHQHFWHYAPATHAWIDDSMSALKRDFLPADLEPLLRANGFEGCVAVQASQAVDETRWPLGLADQHAFIRGVVGWVDLRSKSVQRDLAELSTRKKLVGVRHVVQSEPDDRFVLRLDFQRGIRALAAHDLAYDLLVYPRQLAAAIELVQLFPEQRFVLDHAGKPEIRARRVEPWARLVRDLGRSRNVSCKLSGLVTEADAARWKAADLTPYLDVALDAFGSDRLMIGSDWPVCTLAGDYGAVVSVVTSWASRFTPAERDGILGANATRIYRLQR